MSNRVKRVLVEIGTLLEKFQTKISAKRVFCTHRLNETPIGRQIVADDATFAGSEHGLPAGRHKNELDDGVCASTRWRSRDRRRVRSRGANNGQFASAPRKSTLSDPTHTCPLMQPTKSRKSSHRRTFPRSSLPSIPVVENASKSQPLASQRKKCSARQRRLTIAQTHAAHVQRVAHARIAHALDRLDLERRRSVVRTLQRHFRVERIARRGGAGFGGVGGESGGRSEAGEAGLHPMCLPPLPLVSPAPAPAPRAAGGARTRGGRGSRPLCTLCHGR